MAFRYDVMELNTAVKPFVLAHLLFERGIDRVLYLDPDILVLSTLDPVFRELDACSIVLTPHATRPYQDAKQPDEISLLRTGAYNLGFIGVAKTEESRAMLNWWQERCREHCVVQPEDGLFVDQKWIDLVPGFHPGTRSCATRGSTSRTGTSTSAPSTHSTRRAATARRSTSSTSAG